MAPNNALPMWGNEKTMNLNSLLLTNIQSSPYFKVQLFGLKTYHEVIDEIYYKVAHLEPWEKGSRKTAGQTGMCGGVRGVGTGGIVSSAFCLLYKLYTLKLTRKQVNGLITHKDSPYIRGLGFMYIRYTQPPADLWDWYKDFMEDEEEIDVKAGGGHTIVIGDMLHQFLTKLEWYCTLFPRIPVPAQKDIELKIRQSGVLARIMNRPPAVTEEQSSSRLDDYPESFGEAERHSNSRSSNYRHSSDNSSRHRSRDRSPNSHHSSHRRRSRSRDRKHYRSRSRDRHHSKRSRRDRSPDYGHHHRNSFERDLYLEKHRQDRDRHRRR